MASPAESVNGRYVVLGRIGGGAQGTVWRVRDQVAGVERVLKAVATAAKPAAARALLAEFAHLARLEDPALPRVRDVDVAERGPLPAGTVFFTADPVEGTPLLDAAAAAASDERPRLLWSVARDLAGALATLHAAGLLHHDVTPANVLVVGRGADARGVLLDLGLAAPARPGADARGTVAYLAPEALAGGAEPRSDLWSLGATLHHAATGAPPFAGAELAEVIRAILDGPPPPLPGLPGPLARALGRLLARRPADRPGSAVALAAELDAIAGAVTPPPRPRPPLAVRAAAAPPALVGAEPVIAAIVAALDDGAAGAPVAPRWITGPHGARAGEIVAAAVRRHALARAARGLPAAPRVAGRLDDVLARLGVAERPLGAIGAAAARAGGAVLVDATGDDRAAELARVLAAAGPLAAAVIAWQETAAPPPAPPGLAVVPIAPASIEELAALAGELLGRPVPRAWAAALHAVTGGLPGLAAELVRAAAAAPDPLAVEPAALAADAAAVAAVVAARVDELPAAARDAVRIVALHDGARAPAAIVAEVAPGLPAALAVGALARDGDAVALRPPVAAAVAARIPPDDARALHVRIADAARRAGADDVALAPHLVAAGDPDAPRAAAAAAAALLARGQLRRALALAEAAAADPDPRRAAAARALAARAATGLGRYDDARRAAAAAIAASDGEDRARARLVAARAAQRAGDLDGAAAELAAIDDDVPPAVAAEIAGARARIAVARGAHADALAALGALADDDAAPPACLEAAGLARFYLGEPDAAAARFDALARRAERDGDAALAGRAAALAAMVALHRGDLAAAAALQRRAGDAARAAGDFHAAAVADLNLATALAERGRHGEALPVLARGIAVLDALGARGERAAAEFNRGTWLLVLGDVAGAEAAARAAAGLAAGGDVAVHAELLLGDVARRRGDPSAARARYDAALARAAGPARLAALAARAELAVADGDAPLARRLVDAAAPLAASADDRARLAAVRVAAADAGDPAAIAWRVDAAARAGRDALAAGRADRAWRTLAAAAAAAARAGRPDAAALAREAADVRREVVAATPEAWRARLDDDPDARRLAALDAPPPPPPDAPEPRGPRMLTDAPLEIARLRRLLALSRRLNAEQSLDRLLDDVIDAAIELTEAERGFLLLRREPGQPLEVVVARNFAAGALDEPGGSVSRSIAERAATSGEPVITVDAGLDERFGAATSVAALRLRSVMAVPLRQKGRITGCIYVDHRLRDGAFDDAAARVALDLADIAAVAIENARLAADLRRRQDEHDALAARLAAELDDRDAELTRVRAALPGRDALRGRYDAIVGESPAIVRMLDVVDRATRTELPVVVVGESGTGKELVARALHDHGPRKDRPFVAVNCSAMPEPLLESELFGHVRGAFTGADRDRRGLFEVADGGTLFLDEVAETTPAMQAKLLRVLQDGQVRRVGDERVRTVDVRVVVATQRPLAELVAAGRFREDLRFRLEVIAIDVPPLRDRLDDLPRLVDHFLSRLAPRLGGDAPPAITRAALRALARHAWPGNVRELENAIARACALGGPVIDVEDLPEPVAQGRLAPAPAAGPGADLTLRPALEALERAYVEAAMARAGGNQTVAARLLGLSRFGLQKKLRRLAEA